MRLAVPIPDMKQIYRKLIEGKNSLEMRELGVKENDVPYVVAGRPRR